MKVLIAGDFVPSYRVADRINASDYGFMKDIMPVVSGSDYSIINLEAPVVSREAFPIEKTGPNLKCNSKAIECLAQSGFKCVTLANNHFRDFGEVGIWDTLSSCEKFGIDYVGGGASLQNAQEVLFKQLGGESLAIINCCENEWSIARGGRGGSNPLDTVGISRCIKSSKKIANYVILIVHGGIELYPLPSPRMKDLYRFFIEQGADAVVNHHQHCFSGYEEYNGKPIIYGLGNFCFDHENPPSNPSLWGSGYMVQLVLSETVSFNLIPYVQCVGDDSSVRLIDDKTEFNDRIRNLNSIIENDDLLRESFANCALQHSSLVSTVLSPYSSDLFKRMLSRGFLPSFVNKQRVRRLLSYIQCESHRDVLLFNTSVLLGQD